MNFDFDEEQRLLQKTARDFLEERAPLARVREIFESDALLDASLSINPSRRSLVPLPGMWSSSSIALMPSTPCPDRSYWTLSTGGHHPYSRQFPLG